MNRNMPDSCRKTICTLGGTLLLCMVILLVAAPAIAQKTSGSFTGGSVRLGWDGRSCVPAMNGTIRFNSSQVSTGCSIEICTASQWHKWCP